MRALFAFVFFAKLCETVTDDIVQSSVVVTAQSGENVTLTCDSTSFSFSSVVWFRHVAGRKTQFILATFQISTDYAFYNGFNDTRRFTLQRKQKLFNLHISATTTSDSGFYYCALYSNQLDFHFGATSYLIIKEHKSNSMTVVQQPASTSVDPGDSVTLQCTVDSGTCAEEHSVYWFRHGSGESLPGLLYTLGNRSDECEKSPEARSPTYSCVYSLPKKNIRSSDAGTYYCAVVTCGEILFGNGTQLDVEGFGVSPAFIGMGIVLTFSAILNFALICTRYYRKRCDHCTDQKNHHDTSTKDLEASEKDVADTLNYAALHFNNKNYKSARERRELKEETVYSSVSSHAWE